MLLALDLLEKLDILGADVRVAVDDLLLRGRLLVGDVPWGHVARDEASRETYSTFLPMEGRQCDES